MSKTKVNWSGNKKYSQRNDKTGKFKRSINPNDLMDQRFGRLVVIGIDKYYRNKWYFVCKCDCGNIKIVRYDALMEGKTQSCGCYNKQVNSDRRIHGMYKTRFYKTLENMKSRCLNPNHTSYKNYGGRGITICDRWLGENGFIHFKEDMYDEYLKQAAVYGEENISIDRIDNDGNYCPENCRWVPREIQDNNKSTNIFVEYNGEKLTAKQLNEKYAPNLNYDTLLHRISRCGEGDINIEKLIRDAIHHEEHILEYNGEALRLSEIVSKYGDCRISYSTVLSRLKLGWDIKRALHELPSTHKGQKVRQPISFRKTGAGCISPISFRKETLPDNRSKKKYLYKGEELSVTQLVDKYADPRLTKEIVRDRIEKWGWPIDLALTSIPKRYKNKPVIQPISFKEPNCTHLNFSNNNIIEP